MNVGELVQRLVKYDPELPVVMSQEDEPLGNYEVMTVDALNMQRDHLFRRDPNVWHDASLGSSRDDAPAPVVFLGRSPAWQPVIDGELAPPALGRGD